MTVKFFNRYQPKPIKIGTDFTGHTEVCNQQAKDECEINKILYQYEAGDIDTLPVVREAVYNDVMITPTNYQQAMDMIEKVKSDFYALPKDLQRQFGNVDRYVEDINKMALGDVETLQKYKNFSVTSPNMTNSDVNSSSPGVSSSSISGSDSEIGSTDLKASDNNVSLKG